MCYHTFHLKLKSRASDILLILKMCAEASVVNIKRATAQSHTSSATAEHNKKNTIKCFVAVLQVSTLAGKPEPSHIH